MTLYMVKAAATEKRYYYSENRGMPTRIEAAGRYQEIGDAANGLREIVKDDDIKFVNIAGIDQTYPVDTAIYSVQLTEQHMEHIEVPSYWAYVS